MPNPPPTPGRPDGRTDAADANGTPWWTVQRGTGPVVATAIHDGHGLRPAIAARMALPEAERLREEDPFTGQAVRGVPTHVVPARSRFEVDLNRDEAQAVYERPEQCWGLDVWRAPLPDEEVAASRRYHRDFYAMFGELLDGVRREHPRYVVLDVHSYNHRRDGADAPPMPQAQAPDVNIGTHSMPRERWAWLLDPLIDEIARFDFAGRRLDVRENVAFQGKGELARFVHARHPEAGCAIAFEFKKFYMDEWTGAPIAAELRAMRALIDRLARVATELLDG